VTIQLGTRLGSYVGAVRGVNRQQYAMSRDGRQFLVNTVAEEALVPPVTLVMNWKQAR
jgi:hypothetical protein